MEIRAAQGSDIAAVMQLAAGLGPRAGPFVRSHLDRHHVLVAELDGEVVGMLAYRTDWFQCTFVTLVSVREDHRKRGVARALYRAVEGMSPSPRLFSSTEETNAEPRSEKPSRPSRARRTAAARDRSPGAPCRPRRRRCRATYPATRAACA